MGSTRYSNILKCVCFGQCEGGGFLEELFLPSVSDQAISSTHSIGSPAAAAAAAEGRWRQRDQRFTRGCRLNRSDFYLCTCFYSFCLNYVWKEGLSLLIIQRLIAVNNTSTTPLLQIKQTLHVTTLYLFIYLSFYRQCQTKNSTSFHQRHKDGKCVCVWLDIIQQQQSV